MTKWVEQIEEGNVFYVSDLGGIHKDLGGRFTAIMPATARLGPFDNLEEAQQAVEQNVAALKEYLEAFNQHLVGLTDMMKQ